MPASTGSWLRSGIWRASRRPTRSSPVPPRSAPGRPRPRCSRTPSPASRPGGPAGLPPWVGAAAVGPADPRYSVEPWCVTERGLDLGTLARSESVFALANGHIGLRANLDEGDPHGLPGTYLNSFYELRPLPHAEAGYGYPQSGQTVINVTNGKLIRLLVDDEPFDIRYGTLDSHERSLDLRAGTLTRDVQWTSPAHDTVRITSVRLVSLTQRAVAAISYEVEGRGDEPLRIGLQSELVAHEELPPQSDDPRAAAALEHPLVSEEDTARDTHALLVHRTRRSNLRVAAGMDHMVEGPEQCKTEIMSSPDVCRLTLAARLS